MSLDPQLTQLGLQLADVGIRNTVAGVSDRIRITKARKQDQETINELDEIVNDLLADKNELVQIARAFEQALDAQRISQDEVTYMTESIIPVLRALAGAGEEGEDDATGAMIELLQPILSVETITVLQLLGFNFKRAIGEPLTSLVAQLIAAKAPLGPVDSVALQQKNLELQLALAELAGDQSAFDRFSRLIGS
jgi:hypothetical protein